MSEKRELMSLDQIRSEFHHQLKVTELTRRNIKEMFSKEVKVFTEAANSNPLGKAKKYSTQAMQFTCLQSGEHIRYGVAQISYGDRLESIWQNKNRQYQWLMAEVYEFFVEFLKKLYSFAGLNDSSFWPMSDFGNISVKEIAGKNYSWFLERARDKRNVPDSILARMRIVIPAIQQIEIDNHIGVNVRFIICLVEELRHVVVHQGGIVRNRQEFIDKVVKKSGINGIESQLKCKDFIELYLGTGKFDNHVFLLEMPASDEDAMCQFVFYDIYNSLINLIISYSEVLFTHVQSHLMKCLAEGKA